MSEDSKPNWFHRRYGAGPWHLVSLVLCFLVAGYAALRWVHSPSEVRLAVWFIGAVIGHDFVLFPIYSALDRLLRRGDGARRSPPRVPLVNHVRVPALFAGLLLLLWFPLILNKPEPAYQAATGLDTSPYRDRWLLITAVLFGVSALIYVARLLVAWRRGVADLAPRSGADANPATPSANSTAADQPRS
jgi:hypothetical protein